MRLQFILFIVLSLTAFSVTAQKEIVVFPLRVYDANTGESIPSKLSIFDPSTSKDTILVSTDLDGQYLLKSEVGNIVKVRASSVGYISSSFEFTITVGGGGILPLMASSTILNTTTVTTSKYARPLNETTVSLDVLKPELLQSINANTPERALDKIPGINMIDGQANIRGGSGWSYGVGSRVLFLMDDIPALQADAGSVNWSVLPIENVEQIEIVKGAASALYGSSAMNGIMHLRTGYAKSEPETRVALWGQSWGAPADKSRQWWSADSMPQPFQSGATFSHKRKIGKLDLVASSFFQWEQSFRSETWSRRGRVTANLRYRFTDNLTAGVAVNVNRGYDASYLYWRDGGAGALLPSPITDPVNNLSTRYFVDPFLQYFDKAGNRHKVLGRLYSVVNEVNAGKGNSNNYYYGEYQYQRKLGQTMQLVVGVVGSGNAISAELYGDTTLNSRNFATYAQWEFRGIKKLIVEAGARYEHNTVLRPEIFAGDTLMGGKQTDARPVFRAGLNYQLARGTNLRASWGQGYRYPTVAELFIQTTAGFVIAPNPNLKAETGWSSELGVKQVVKIGDWVGFADASVFWSRYFNMMEFNIRFPQLNFQSQNIGNTDIRGTEFSLMGGGKIGNIPVQALMGYTYILPTFRSEADQKRALTSDTVNILKYRFQHVVKSDVQATFGKFDIGAVCNYNSRMVNIDAFFDQFIEGVGEFRNQHTDILLFDARVAYHINKDLKLTLQGTNLTNQTYTFRPALLEAPRGLSLRLDWKI